MEADFTIDEVVNLMKKTKKTDPLFKPLKKLKTALEGIGLSAVSFVPTSKIFVFHFGLGNEIDKQFVHITQPVGLAHKISIIPGHSYCILQFINSQAAINYTRQKIPIYQKELYFQELKYQNISRTLIFMYCREDFLKEAEIFNIQNCISDYSQTSLPGLLLYENIMTIEEEAQLIEKIDAGKWEKLNNRRVQHFGYKFKYGRNQIDRDQKEGILPQFFANLLKRLSQINILKGLTFDQLTINDYFAGNGIPSHFDTHSPFEEVFISVSLLSGLVMDFRKFDGEEKRVYLKQRSVAIFSGEARYAWIHGISCRKIDKVDNEIHYRSRRLSLTFRKIKFTPCHCPYYFYCDSQGYDQETMKKHNPLLKKYLSEIHSSQLTKFIPSQIEKQFVQKAYNGFGFDFHNKVIDEIRNYMEKEFEREDFVLDLGCGNGQYKKYVKQSTFYVSVEKCTVMQPVQDQIYMDCLSLNFRENAFDKVIFVAVLHHFASPSTRVQALIEIWKVMRQEGTLYLTVLSYESKTEIYSSPQIFLEYCLPLNKISIKTENNKLIDIQIPRVESRGEVFRRYYHLFTVEEISNILKLANFAIIQISLSKQNIIVKATKLPK